MKIMIDSLGFKRFKPLNFRKPISIEYNFKPRFLKVITYKEEYLLWFQLFEAVNCLSCEKKLYFPPMENIIYPGRLLISDPFLKDPNFLRTTVLVCDSQPEGSFGFVLNKRQEHVLGELIEDLYGNNFPVYFGGPVQTNTLHFLHQCPELITGGTEILNGVYLGGDFADVINLLLQQKLKPHQIRFFVGYSGWGEGQLQQEIDGKSWILSNCSRHLLFNTNPENSWKVALQELGGEYQRMVNYPLDPQYN